MEQVIQIKDNTAFVVNTLAPAGSQGDFLGVSHRANKFYVIDASGEFMLRTDISSEVPFKQGQGRTFLQDFNRLELRNKSASPISVRIWIGNGEYKDQRFQLLESSTEFIPDGLTVINAGNEEVYNGIPTVNQISRKAIIVSNNDTSNNLLLKDELDNAGIVVFPKTSVMIPTSGYVKVANDTGVNVSCTVAEIWYTT